MSDNFSHSLNDLFRQRLESSQKKDIMTEENLCEIVNIIRPVLIQDLQNELINQEIHLTKLIEQQAIYRLGRLEEQLEQLKSENSLLKDELEGYKLLGTVEELKNKIEEKETSEPEEIMEIEIPWWKKIFGIK